MKKKNGNPENPDLRHKAEELIKNKKSAAAPQYIETEILKLLQELEVHQIELELQNEQLLLAKEEAEKATEKYIELYDYAPSGYFTLSQDGNITKLNFAGAKMLGKDRLQLINRRFGLFVSGETMETFNLFIEKVFRGSHSETCDITLSGNGSVEIDVHLSGIISVNGDECFVSAVDITERNLLEEKLAESEKKWHKLFEILPVGVSILDYNMEITDWNPALKKILGISDSEIGSETYRNRSYLKPDSSSFSSDQFPSIVAVKEQRIVENVELKVLKEDGTPIWLDVSAAPLPFYNAACVIVTVDITDRKITEKRLHDNTALINSIVNNTTDAIYVKDIAGRYILLNSSAGRIFGRSPAEVIGRCDSDILLKEEADAIMKSDRQVLDEGIVRTDEEIITVAQGKVLTFLSTKGAIFDPHGSVSGLYCIARDISERKKMEESLYKSRRDFASLVENATDIILRYDTGLRYIYCNPAFDRQLEAGGNSCLGKTPLDAGWPVEIGEYFHKSLESVLERGDESEIEQYYDTPSGRKYFQTRIVPERDADGKIESLMAVSRDITSHKKAELELERYREHLESLVRLRTSELYESEKRYREIINSITDYVYQVIIDENNEVKTIYSETCFSVTGYHAYEFREDSMLWMNIVFDKDREKVNDFIKKIITGELTEPKIEHRIIHKDGKIIWVDDTIVLHRNPEGQLAGYDGVIRDITERKTAEIEIINLNRHIIKLQEEERQRVAEDLHDGVGQTILAAKINIDTYKQDPVRFAGQLDAGLSFIIKASQELRDVYSGLYPTILKDLGLEMAIRWLLYNTLETGGIKVFVNINLLNRLSNELNVVLYRIIQEIISNIQKHSRASKVDFTLSGDNNRLDLVVKDDGVGFNPEGNKKLISGYGLVNIKSRIDGFNGKLTFENNDPHGLVLRVSIDLSYADLYEC